MTTLAYPRLDTVAALELLGDLSTMTYPELVAESAVTHPRTSWYETAPNRVSEDALRWLQADIRKLAAECGYPASQARGPNLTRFDRGTAIYLISNMGIIPADAAEEGVWSFVSLVLLPDVAFWRFPNRELRSDYERILGRPRNVFRRLWWRGFAFGTDADGPSAELLEDEVVAILERPTLGGDPRIAKAVGWRHLKIVDREKALSRTLIMREAMKRLRRLAPVVALSALSDEDLASLVGEVFDSACLSMAERRP